MDSDTAGKSFEDITQELLGLYHRGEYTAALAVASDAEARFPDQRATTSFWQACLLARTGDSEAALQMLVARSDEGLWWSPTILEEDDDLAPLRKLRAFRDLVDESRRRQEQARASLPEVVLIEMPEDEAAHRSLVVLHGRHGNAEMVMDAWARATRHGFVVAAPQAPAPTDATLSGFIWDRLAAAEAVARASERVATRAPVSADHQLIGGFSQGGEHAVLLALAHEPMAFDGFIVVGPVVDTASIATTVDQARQPVKGYIIVGENDWTLPGCRSLHAAMTARGFPCELEVVSDTGHEVPRDFDARLDRAVAWITDDDEPAQE